MAIQYPLGALWQNGGLGSFAAAGAALGVAMMAIGWMAASFLQDERLKAWTKTELLKVGFSIILVSAALALFSSGAIENALFELTRISVDPAADAGWLQNHVLVCGVGGGEALMPPCHVRLAIDYLDTLYKTAKNFNRENFMVYSNFAMLSNINMSFRGWLDFFPMGGFNPFIALSIPSDTVAIAFDLTIKMMMATRFLEFLVDISYSVLFPTFLILGLVLRMFFFSRKLGGMLVALALALYLVLPTYFAMMDYVLYKMTGGWASDGSDDGKIILGNSMNASVGEIDVFNTTRLEKFETNVQDEFFNPDGTVKDEKKIELNMCSEEGDAGGQNLGILGTASRTIGSSVTKGFVHAMAFMKPSSTWESDPLLGPNGTLDITATLLVYAIVVPFLGLMIMLASIKVFSPLIGGDVEIAGISRLL